MGLVTAGGKASPFSSAVAMVLFSWQETTAKNRQRALGWTD
jgi:hypothetical protein